ncbi:MAG: hypothetical protein ACREUM_07125 [Nitrosospira sp.]
MRYLTGVIFLASCAMLTPAPVEERAIEQPGPEIGPEVKSRQSESKPEIRKLKSKPSPPSEVSSCASLDTGDLKETIKAKLDCITENAK